MRVRAPASKAAPTGELIWRQQNRFLAPGGRSGDAFGNAVSIDGSTVLVGQFGAFGASLVAQGAAWVLFREPEGWFFQARFQGTLGVPAQNFGQSVSVSGDVAVIGAPGDVVDDVARGGVYVFARRGLAWNALPSLSAADGAAGDAFGTSVAISGDSIVVGAPEANVDGAPRRGAAYVFVREGEGFAMQKKLVAADGAAGDRFGWQVAVSGSTALVGARNADNAGAAYVFERAGTAWNDGQKLVPGGSFPRLLFGTSVALSGDDALVSAYGVTAESRRAYVFTRAPAGWSEQDVLSPAAGAADGFGVAVALAEGRAFVGAPSPGASSGVIGPGSVHVFERSGTRWSRGPVLQAFDGQPHDDFGFAVAASGRSVVVGADFHDTDERANEGAAYRFQLGAPDGTDCASASACASGFCVDGVCCPSVCEDGCHACSVSAGGTEDGVCADLSALGRCAFTDAGEEVITPVSVDAGGSTDAGTAPVSGETGGASGLPSGPGGAASTGGGSGSGGASGSGGVAGNPSGGRSTGGASPEWTGGAPDGPLLDGGGVGGAAQFGGCAVVPRGRTAGHPGSVLVALVLASAWIPGWRRNRHPSMNGGTRAARISP